MSKETLEKRLAIVFPGKVKEGFRNSIKGW